MTVEDLANQLDVSPDIVQRQAKRYENEAGQRKAPPFHSRLSAEDIEKPWADEDVLEHLFIEQELTPDEISERLGCVKSTVNRWIRQHNLRELKDNETRPWQKEETLYNLYIEQELSGDEIAEKLGCHSSTIFSWLRRFGISRAESGPWQNKDLLKHMYKGREMSVTEIADELGCNHSTISNWLAKHKIPTRGRPDVTHQLFDEEVVDEDDEPYNNEELLRQLYVEERKTISEMVTELGCSSGIIYFNLARYDIERDDEIDMTDIESEIPDEYPWRDKSLMRELYVDKRLSQIKIADIFSCSNATISEWLQEHGIDTIYPDERPSKTKLTNLYVEQEQSGIQLARRFDVDTNTIYAWLDDIDIQRRERKDYVHPVLKDENKLRKMYVDKEMSVVAISNELNSAPSTVHGAFEKFGIELRDRREYITGENNPFWNGGTYPYGKGWNQKKREEVLEEHGHLCQGCGMSKEEHEEEYGQSLHIHHIQPARAFDDPQARNAVSNLVPMCSKCHRKWEGIPLRPSFSAN